MNLAAAVTLPAMVADLTLSGTPALFTDIVFSSTNYQASGTATVKFSFYADAAASTMFSGITDGNLIKVRIYVRGMDFSSKTACKVELTTAVSCVVTGTELIEIGFNTLATVVQNQKLTVTITGATMPAEPGV